MSRHISKIPALRLNQRNQQPLNEAGDFILYWMTANRRPFCNFALQQAVAWALQLRKPLLILEALRCDYPYASDRLHRFILDGMADNASHFATSRAHYYPYVETARGAGKGLLKALAKAACLVVTDDSPAFFYPHMLGAAASQIPVRLEAVDANGLLPLSAAPQAYPTAYAFRRFLQKELRGHLLELAETDPLADVELPQLPALPEEVCRSWPPASAGLLAAAPATLATLPLDHAVAPTAQRGGWRQAELYLRRFLEERLPNYLQRSEPERRVTSELSPYLHFGQIASQQVFLQLAAQESWSFDRLSPETKGKRSGWWGVSAAAEAFLDQLITWRELGFNSARHLDNYAQYRSLPDWARQTLDHHRDDPRPYRYPLETFEQARTHDPLWNAAQTQLLSEGTLHNYLRMLWGKKILEWSPDAETALQTMLTLNDRYALDGRDPNSVSGIFWCLGRYDRPWGPERPIFGKIRYMSSANTARKFSLTNYLARYGPEGGKNGETC